MTTTELESTRQINATPEEVYAVWLDPACPGSPWYGPNANGMTSKVIFTAKVDAVFYHCVNNKGQAWYHYGRFIQLEPNEVATPACPMTMWVGSTSRVGTGVCINSRRRCRRSSGSVRARRSVYRPRVFARARRAR